jgi:hypothetical protein
MKRKKAVAISLLSLAFAGAAAHLEWAGYSYFDRQNGPNWLCVVDPGCRHLTADEIILAEKQFGRHIDYSSVKIFNRPLMGIFGHGHNAIAPNGNIYLVNKEERRNNFARDYDHRGQRIFIHEITHVSQHQKGMNVPKMAIKEFFRHAFDYSASYKYTLNTTQPYGRMNLEQQAEMMEDYFSLRSTFSRDTTAMGESGFPYRINPHGAAWLKARCHEMTLYERKLEKYFPIRRDSLCP